MYAALQWEVQLRAVHVPITVYRTQPLSNITITFTFIIIVNVHFHAGDVHKLQSLLVQGFRRWQGSLACANLFGNQFCPKCRAFNASLNPANFKICTLRKRGYVWSLSFLLPCIISVKHFYHLIVSLFFLRVFMSNINIETTL